MKSSEQKINPQEQKLPTLTELFCSAKNIRKEYHGKKPSRLEFIRLLEIVHEYAEQLYLSGAKENELHDICLGAWVFCYETIAQEYTYSNPEYSKGYLYASGSTLYNTLLKELNINKNSHYDVNQSLKFLNAFHHFLFKPEDILIFKKPIVEIIYSNKISTKLKSQLIQIMRVLLVKEGVNLKRILQAIPCEKAIDRNMIHLYQNYISQSKSSNAERRLLAKFAVTICQLNPFDEDLILKNHESYLARTKRIKMGMLIYIMESIHSTYIVRSPKGNSVLYDLCNKILVNSYENLEPALKFACLTAFENYINDPSYRELIEIAINKDLLEQNVPSFYFYVDPIIHQISRNVSSIILNLSTSINGWTVSHTTLTVASIGALIGAAPGYGAGYTLGYGLSLTDQITNRKEKFSQVTGYAMRCVFKTGGLNFYVADTVINAMLHRVCGKLFEAIGASIFALGAGGLSFFIYDLSYGTIKNLCNLYIHLNQHMNPSSLKQADMAFIKTLLDLPEEVFSNSKKEHLKNLTVAPVKLSEMGFLSRSSLESLETLEPGMDDSFLFKSCVSEKMNQI